MSKEIDQFEKFKNNKEAQKQAVLLESKIIKLEREIDEKYYQLGRSIYELADRKFDEIDRIVDNLVDAKVHLSQLQGHHMCVHCLAQNPIENHYCGKCGKKIERDELNE